MRVVGVLPSRARRQWEDLLFAWRVCRHVRSNAIVIAATAPPSASAPAR